MHHLSISAHCRQILNIAGTDFLVGFVCDCVVVSVCVYIMLGKDDNEWCELCCEIGEGKYLSNVGIQ